LEPTLSPKDGDKDGAAALPTSVGVRVETEERLGCVVEKKQQVPPLGLKPSVGMTPQWLVVSVEKAFGRDDRSSCQ
jgi:hypothetical protein